MRSLRFLLPLLLFIGIGWFLLKGLDRDPRRLPSALIDKPVPAFSLPVLADDQSTQWSPEALRGKVWLLNVWASWCAACQIEHPLLNEFARAGHDVPIVGFAWKDRREDSVAWLNKFGNPYAVVISDQDGKVAIDWGVYGAPETFLVDQRGIIRWKQVGPFSAEIIRDELMPMLRKLKAQ